MGRLFGTDGIRGKANTYLTCEMALKVGRATATVLADDRRRLRFCIVATPESLRICFVRVWQQDYVLLERML